MANKITIRDDTIEVPFHELQLGEYFSYVDELGVKCICLKVENGVLFNFTLSETHVLNHTTECRVFDAEITLSPRIR